MSVTFLGELVYAVMNQLFYLNVLVWLFLPVSLMVWKKVKTEFLSAMN
jgi:hypothetical protein